MRYLVRSFLLISLLATPVASAGQAAGAQVRPLPGPPPRDRPLPAEKGTGTIEGMVIDEATGQGIPRAVVQLGGSGGRPESIRADEQGAFAFAGLRAGRYFVSAQKSGYTGGPGGPPPSLLRASRRDGGVVLADGERRRGVEVKLGRASVITGRVLDAYGDPLEFTQVSVSRIAGRSRRSVEGGRTVSTNDLGEYRIPGLAPGDYVVCATPRGMMVHGDEPVRPIDTCYPGTPVREEAVPVTVERSQTVGGIDITVVEREALLVTGRVVDGAGQPATTARLEVVQPSRGGSSSSGTFLKPDGSFRLQLAPGTYQLVARRPRPTADPAVPPDEEVGVVPIRVDAEPLMDVEVRLGSAGLVSGRLVFEGQSPRPAPPQQAGLHFAGDDSGSVCHSRGPVVVAADGTFRATNVLGTCAVEAYAPGRWVLKGIYRDGTLLRDRTITIGTEPIRDLRVVFTDRPASLTFQVADERGNPTREFVVFVFSTGREQWGRRGPGTLTYVPRDGVNPGAGGGPTGDGASMAPSAPASRADLSRVLPGEYYVAAVDDASWEDTRDPEFLAELADAGVRITLAEGEHRTLSLRRVIVKSSRP